MVYKLDPRRFRNQARKQLWRNYLFLKNYFYYFVILCICVSVCGYVHRCRCPQESKRSWLPEAGVPGGCEPPDLGAGNRTYFLCSALNHPGIGTLTLSLFLVLDLHHIHPAFRSRCMLWFFLPAQRHRSVQVTARTLLIFIALGLQCVTSVYF